MIDCPQENFRANNTEEAKRRVYQTVMELLAVPEYQEGELVRLALRTRSSPALTARTVLEQRLAGGHLEPQQLKQRVSLLMKDTRKVSIRSS